MNVGNDLLIRQSFLYCQNAWAGSRMAERCVFVVWIMASAEETLRVKAWIGIYEMIFSQESEEIIVIAESADFLR